MSDAAAQDGRTARRLQNADAVVDAVLDLIAEGRLQPPAAEIAERSGVSARSLFRYFDDMEALLRIAVERQTARKDHLFQALPADGDVDERVDRLVEHRLALWREVGGVVRAVWLQAPVQQAIAIGLAHRHRQLRDQVSALFPEADEDAVVAIDLVTGFESLGRLEGDPAAARVLRRAVRALVRG